MPNFGPVHKLIVHEVGEPYGPLSTGEFKDFEIEHAPECKTRHDDMLDCDVYDCAVAFNVEQVSARYLLNYVGTPVTEPGEYAIRAWATTYKGFDYTEYDGGIALEKE